MRPARLGGITIVAVAGACATVAPTPSSPAPINQCQTQQDCGRYMQTGVAPICSGGSCLWPPNIDPSWILVVSLSQYAVFAPSTTIAIPFETLYNQTPLQCPPNLPPCAPPTCLQLPPLATPAPPNANGELDVLPNASGPLEANWNLGNGQVTTVLPVKAVFRPQWPGSPTGDAASLGLPLDAIEVPETINSSFANPGPGGGPSLQFPVSLPPLQYERTLMPMPPWDQAFPPDVRIVDYVQAPYPDSSVLYGCTPNPSQPSPPGQLCASFDTVVGTNNQPSYPQFNLSRADGASLGGWTAYLRDQTTLRRISNLAQLTGTMDSNVQLLTSHNPMGGNALANAALVMQPTASDHLPTAIFKAVDLELASQEQYPLVPARLTFPGKITDSAGKPVVADVVFDSTGICRSVASGPQLLDSNGDLTYSTTASADAGSFQVTLPLGEYRVTVRPRDTTHAVTVLKNYATETNCAPVTPNSITVGAQPIVSGTASVADGRALAAAALDAVPARCSDGSTDASCLPRDAHAITTAQGGFAISLDPGAYFLRVQPAEGTRLPWVVQPISVAPIEGPSGASQPVLVHAVPAPVYFGVTLEDPGCNPVFQGLVRMYEVPAMGSAFEIGEALTDATGHFDMYLDPSAQ